jgi:HK97 family phage major capsid protein
MFELLKRLKAQMAKGFATVAEKSAFKAELKELSADEQEVAEEKVAEVEALPEEAPASEDESAELEKSIKSIFSAQGKELKTDVLDQVQKIIDAQAKKKSDGLGVYAPDVNQDAVAKRKASSNRMQEVLKSLYTGSFTPKYKEMTSDSSGTPYAGFVTDSELSAEIRHLVTEYGVAAREMVTVSLSQKSYKANNLATDVTVYWVDEGAVIASTQAVLGQQTLELKKLGAIVSLTRELLDESEIDFISFLGTRVAEGFAEAEDLAFFIGDGSSTYGDFTGLTENTSTNNVAMASGETDFTDLTADMLLEMIDATPQGALANGKFYMHRTIRSVVRKLKDTTGNYIYQEPAANAPATIWGRPIVDVEAMPSVTDTAVSTAFVLFGDLKKSSIRGIRGGIKADRFNAGTVRNVAANADINLITTDREAVRWIEEVGAIAIIPTAVTRLTTAAS